MDKAESKYKNTALLMDQALLILLEKKDLEFITIKEICSKAGVNRSTFYLHYENINDLFNETVDYLNQEFLSSFSLNMQFNKKPDDYVFIKKEFIIPYLEFVKKNKRVMKMIHSKPLVFNNEKIYEKMKKEIFIPAVEKHRVAKDEQTYVIEFFTKGVVAIVSKWLEGDCSYSVDSIMNIILKCTGFND